jgi:fructose-1,6-bisphosphatase I
MSCDQVKRWSLLDIPCKSCLVLAEQRLTYRYGSSCNLVLSCGQGVDGFTLDEVRFSIPIHKAPPALIQKSLGEFILTHPEIKIPSRGKIYSFNEGNSQHFYPPTNDYLNSIKFPSNNKPYSARYIGSMVADVHRTLLYGGIFGYPDDKKSKDGKLRMLYEAFPMSFLIEQVSRL